MASQVSIPVLRVSHGTRLPAQNAKAKRQGAYAAKESKHKAQEPLIAPKSRATKGTVAIENVYDRLRLRFRVAGHQYTLTMGLSDTPEHRTHCKAIAAQIERDVVYGHFDSSLCKYKPAHLQRVKDSENLAHLWERFTAHRKSQIAETTLITKYGAIKRQIDRLPKKNLKDAPAIRDYLIETLPPKQCKFVLMMLGACCAWAVKSGRVSHNPFADFAREIRIPKDSRTHIDPFSASERDVILTAFDSHPRYAQYAPFVRFLFFTGCRISEAVGLRWKHVDSKRILFRDVMTVVSGKLIAKGTKTGEAREFPMNAQLKALLASIKPPNATPEDLVFTTKKGRPVHLSNFFNCAWAGREKDGNYIPGIVTELANSGKITRYRCPYTTRHTFITLMLEAGFTAPEVAKLVGNSPEIIMQHYAGCTRKLTVPEF